MTLGLWLFDFTDEYHVDGLFATRHRQPLPVMRPSESTNSIRGEVGQLLGLAAADRHAPDVSLAAALSDISKGATIGHPANLIDESDGGWQLGNFRRWPAIEWNQPQMPAFARVVGDMLPIGRDARRRRAKISQLHWVAAINPDLPQPLSLLVDDPSPVGRARRRKAVEFEK